MLVLDYTISEKSKDPSSIEDLNLSGISLADLHYSNLFNGDVIIKDENVDLSAEWGWVPILHFAEVLYFISENILSSGHEVYEYTENSESLSFDLAGNMLNITASYSNQNIQVPIEVFKKVSQNLLLKAYQDFCELRPEAIDSPAMAEVKKNVQRIEEAKSA